jgi:hypothetical protein
MALNDFFKRGVTDVSVDGEVIIDASTSGTGAVEIHEVFASGGINIIKEIDTTGDGTFDVSVRIESQDRPLHSQKNQIEVSADEDVRIKVVNIANEKIDFGVNGIEVSD